MNNQIAQIHFDYLQKVSAPKFNSTTRLANLVSGPISIVTISFFGAGVLLLLYLISGGFSYMLSGGDPKKVESAKGKISNALLGFIIVIFAFFIVQALGLILGLDGVIQVFGR